MDSQDYSSPSFEPNVDELPPKSNYDFALDRRKFFKITGGGLIVVFVLKDLFSFGNRNPSSEISSVPGAAGVESWLHIGEDGRVTVYTGKVEVGQNIRTSLSQIVAEELMVPVMSIKMIMGDTDLVPYDAGTFVFALLHKWVPNYAKRPLPPVRP